MKKSILLIVVPFLLFAGAGTQNLTIEQGATFTRYYQYCDEDTVGVDISDYIIRMKIRKFPASTTELLSCTESNYISKTADSTSGWFQIVIPATITDDLSFSTAVYDIELQTGTTVYRIVKGKIVLDREVTW